MQNTSAMSNSESFDLTDLFEYDEFDSFDAPRHTFHSLESVNDDDFGVPLSVELSQSICQNIANASVQSECTTNDHDLVDFVKAPEIFLRIGDAETATGTTTTITTSSTKKTDGSDKKTDSIESTGSDVSVAQTNHGDIVELQYENEFSDPNTDEYDVGNLGFERSTQFENDNEQLLFEGIHYISVCLSN